MGRVGSKRRWMEQGVSFPVPRWGRLAVFGVGLAGVLLACTTISDDAELSSEGTLTHSGGRPGLEPDAGLAGTAGAEALNAGSSGSAGASGSSVAAGSGSAGTSA